MATNMQELIDEYHTQVKTMQDNLQSAFMVYVKEFFEKNPEIKTIKWAQYTPYFNDGDACIFSVNDPTFSNSPNPNIVSTWGEIDDVEDETLWATQGTWGIEKLGLSKETEKAMDDFSATICSSAMEDVMLNMFGDHAEVTCTESGFDVEEYQHD